jgi:hypothetical protein
MEHPVNQPIKVLTVCMDGPNDTERYAVGFGGVTRIEATTKSGMHADIPYLRVWKGDVAVAEYCQHNIIGIEFDETPAQ